MAAVDEKSSATAASTSTRPGSGELPTLAKRQVPAALATPGLRTTVVGQPAVITANAKIAPPIALVLRLAASALSLVGIDIQSPTAPKSFLSALVWGVFRRVENSLGVSAPVAGTPSADPPDLVTGAVTGTLQFTDPNGLEINYRITTQTTKGTIGLDGAGAYTYTPTVAARLAAALAGAPVTDFFVVVADDGLKSTAAIITVAVSPDTPVAGTPTVNSPTATGVVSGSANFSDPASLAITFVVSVQPTQGAATTTSTGAFTYTPTHDAQQAARDAGRSGTDTFTITATNLGGYSASQTITVPIAPLDVPQAGLPFVGAPDLASDAKVSGNLHVSDPNGQSLSYTVTTEPTSGSVSVTDTGEFTYAPTVEARLAAWSKSSDAVNKPVTDTFVVTVTNGQASVTQTVSVPISPMQIPLDFKPIAMAVSPDNNTLYVSGGGYTLDVIDAATHTVTATVNLPYGGGQTMTLSPDGKTLYVPVYGGGVVTVVDTGTATVTTNIPTADPWPFQVAVSPDNKFAYVTDHTLGAVSVIDAVTNTIVGSIVVGGAGELDGIAISQDGKYVYTVNAYDFMSVIDTDTHSVATILGGGVFGVVVSPDGKTAYGSEGSGENPNVVEVIDTATKAITDSIDVGGQPFFMAMSPDGKSLFVVASGQLVTISIATNSITNTVGVSGAYWNLAISPDGAYAYVPLYWNSTVAVVPLATASPIRAV